MYHTLTDISSINRYNYFERKILISVIGHDFFLPEFIIIINIILHRTFPLIYCPSYNFHSLRLMSHVSDPVLWLVYLAVPFCLPPNTEGMLAIGSECKIFQLVTTFNKILVKSYRLCCCASNWEERTKIVSSLLRNLTLNIKIGFPNAVLFDSAGLWVSALNGAATYLKCIFGHEYRLHFWETKNFCPLQIHWDFLDAVPFDSVGSWVNALDKTVSDQANACTHQDSYGHDVGLYWVALK